jgi:glycosyltransferase involved in cell wall biosynthesis
MGANAESRPLRVLHAFATFVPAGPQLRTLDLIAGLGDEFEHEIIACDDELSARHSTPEGCRYACLPCPKGAGPLGSVRAWRALLNESKPDLLLTYNWGSFDAVLAARSLGVGHHVHHEEGFNADEAQGQLRRRVWARRLGLGRIARLVVPSRLLEDVAKDEWNVDPAKVQLVLNGVCTERFRSNGAERARIRTELGLTSEDLLLGSVGHLRPIKRYDRLLRSLARMGDSVGQRVHLCLVGAGPERERLEALAVELGLTDRVHWAGHQTDLPGWYSAMDLFTLTSDSEQLPVSLLEAMACGLAVAGTDVGDVRATLPESTRDQLVALAHDDVEGELARLYSELLGDSDKRTAQGQLNRERVQRDYSREQMLTTYRDLYLEAAKR